MATNLGKKILIIGNSSGGKTTLARVIGASLNINVTHIDGLQFLPDMKLRPYNETLKLMAPIIAESNWIIDGFGPLDDLHTRMTFSDQIFFIDLPFRQHAIWFWKRQLQNLWSRRLELPEGSQELNLQHILKGWDSLRKVQQQMLPELRRILQRPEFSKKTVHIQNRTQFKHLLLSISKSA